jgi:hypothetical protein
VARASLNGILEDARGLLRRDHAAFDGTTQEVVDLRAEARVPVSGGPLDWARYALATGDQFSGER